MGVVMLLLVVLSGVFGMCSAKTVVVGGSTGWTIPTTSASFYSSWASQNKLQVGDVLVFKFPAGIHTVAEVSKPNYDSCTSASTLGPVMTTAPANITLTKPGTHYFICTITGHCSANQKLTVSVSSSSLSSPKSSPSPSPSTSPVPSPVPTPTSTPTPSPVPDTPSPTPATTPEAVSPGPSTDPALAGTPEGEPGTASPPAGNVAAATGVSLLSLLSIVAMSLMF
ncbi:hypothetical protein vseg_000474 [Gypsophila vaccaria]